MQNWKLKYHNHNQKTDNALKKYMHFSTQNNEIYEGQDQQIMSHYFQKHISLVNKHRNEEKIELQKIKEQLKCKLHQRKKSRQISLRRIKQYDNSIQLEHKIYINNPNMIETSKDKLLKTQIDSCTKLINNIKRRSIEKKMQFSQMCLRQNQQSTLPTILPKSKRYKQFNYNDQYNISTQEILPFQSNQNRSQMILSNSLNHTDLKNYRSRYNNSQSVFKPLIKDNEGSKSIQFKSQMNSPQKRLSNCNYKYNSLNQNQEKPSPKLTQLLNLYKLKTQNSQVEETPSSVRSKQKHLIIKKQNKPINFKSKQKELDQLYKAKVRGARFYQKIKELKSKQY